MLIVSCVDQEGVGLWFKAQPLVYLFYKIYLSKLNVIIKYITFIQIYYILSNNSESDPDCNTIFQINLHRAVFLNLNSSFIQ